MWQSVVLPMMGFGHDYHLKGRAKMSRSYWDTERTYSQPAASQIRENARQTAKQEWQRGRILEPVVISGEEIATTWWGRAWCDNLEKYMDYENRLERGIRYVRTGAVVDLKIQKGKVVARVQGRRKAPYKVEVRISPLSEERCQAAIKKCSRRIESLDSLMRGDFPEELKELFVGEQGLFPKPQEISLICSCPDWAILCKHVAAVLYGIGKRFDEDPRLFFELRGIDVNRFVDITMETRIDSMLRNADRPSTRIIESDDWKKMFGVL